MEELINKLQNEIEYTKLSHNLQAIFQFISDKERSKDLTPYHRLLLEMQFNAMNLYLSILHLRISDLINQNNQKQSLDVETSTDSSNQQE